MLEHGTHQRVGGRDVQCDAAATRSNATTGTRAWAVLDGIGDRESVRDFTRNAAVRLARSAARLADAETALRRLMTRIAFEPGRPDPWGIMPGAAAIVAVHRPGRPLTIAWAGDCRAYHLDRRRPARKLSRDHNMRRLIEDLGTPAGPWARNRITSYLGATPHDAECLDNVGHPAVETAELTDARGRLLLATDGAYEPLDDSGVDLNAYLTDPPAQAARRLTRDAVERTTTTRPDNATCLIVNLDQRPTD